MSGVTPEGFEIKTLSEIIADLESAQRANIAADFVSKSTSVAGQINGIVGAALAELWQVAQAAYAAQSRDTASDGQLDNVGALNETDRLAATATTVELTINGTPTTVIPINSVVSDPNTPTKKVSTDAEVTIPGGGTITVEATATETGPIVMNEGTLTKIDTPISGWTSVTNVDDATTGRDIETNAAYRLRQAQSFGTGVGPHDALQKELLEITGVTTASVYTNTSSVAVGGVDPHTVECVIEGGDDQDIVDAIVLRVGLGIGTSGNDSGSYTDTQGNVYAINFSRPETVEIKVNATLTKIGSAYLGDAEWKQALADFINALLPGRDVVRSKALSLGASQAGVDDLVTFQIARVGDSFGVINIPLDAREVAHLNTSNVTLVSTSIAGPA